MTTAPEPSAFYTGLVARLYAPLRSTNADPAPYTAFVRHAGGPALELGCGDGEPLLALRAEGLDVEGLDSSADMLDRCRVRADAAGLDVVLHHASMEAMDLGRTYRAIYLAGPTFNLLPDDERVAAALARIHAHLEPGGRALVPLFVPEDDPNLGRTRVSGTMRVTPIAAERDDEARVMTTVLRYEDGGEVLERPWVLHWHTQDGFRTLAEAAGLVVQAVLDPDSRPAAPDADAVAFVLRRPAPD